MAGGGDRHFKQGDHVCAIYDDAEEQVAVAAAYIAEGLRCQERCLYSATAEPDLDRFRLALRLHGVDAEGAEATGALLLRVTTETHLASGSFNSELMLRMLNDMVEAALNDGFAGLRTCGDMSWLLGEPPGAEHVVEYEALLNPFFEKARALGMCQYDRRRLPPGLLDHALATHPLVTMNEAVTPNPFYRRQTGGSGQ